MDFLFAHVRISSRSVWLTSLPFKGKKEWKERGERQRGGRGEGKEERRG